MTQRKHVFIFTLLACRLVAPYGQNVTTFDVLQRNVILKLFSTLSFNLNF